MRPVGGPGHARIFPPRIGIGVGNVLPELNSPADCGGTTRTPRWVCDNRQSKE